MVQHTAGRCGHLRRFASRRIVDRPVADHLVVDRSAVVPIDPAGLIDLVGPPDPVDLPGRSDRVVRRRPRFRRRSSGRVGIAASANIRRG